MEIKTVAPQVPVTMMIIITDIKKGTCMVGRKELTIDHDIGPVQVVLIEIISKNDVSTLEKENVHPIPIITKVGHRKVAQYQLAIDAVHVPGQVPQRENRNNLHTTIYMNRIHVLCLLIDSSSIEGRDSQLSPSRAHLYSTDPHYYRTNTHDFGGQNLSPHASCPDVWILNHPNYASQFDLSRSESCSILHPGFVNIHQDSYRKHCTSPPQQPNLLDQNPQYLHSHHNKYKCQPDSPYPRILGQHSPIFYKPWASQDSISAPTWGGHEQFIHPRCSPHYAEKDVHISRKDNYPKSPVQPETVSRDDRDREYHNPRSSNCTDANFVSHKDKYVPNTSPLGSPPVYTFSPHLESGHNDRCATSQIQTKDKCDSSAYVHKVDGILQNQKEKRDKHEHTDTVPSIPNESGPPHESYKLGSQVYGPTPILSKEKSDQMHEDKTQDDNSHVANSFMAVVEV